jgi:NodT family efflux transporter outer membrane factor (OMF) lipoprotein
MVYHDQILNDLEAQVDISNPTLAVATATYDRAREFSAEADARIFPVIGLGGNLTTNKQSERRPLRSRGQPTYYGGNTLDVQASYELDFWGQIRDAIAAGEDEAQASAANLETVRLTLHAELASDYMTLRGLDAEAKLLANTVDTYQQAYHLTLNLFEGKVASGMDVSRAETQLDDAEAQVSDVASRRALLEHAIATLIGKPAAAVSIAPTQIKIDVPDVPVGLPSTLLQRRPDIASAERQVAAANEGIGVAESAFYPTISIGATGGVQSTSLNLLDLPNDFWSVGPAMALPLFEGGLRHAELGAAKAAYDEAAGNYRATVLDAFQEVEDNLALMHWLGQEQQQEGAAAQAAQQTLNMSMNLYRDGADSYLDVVTAQTSALQAERATIALGTRQIQASIGLIRALGGGWSTDQLPKHDQMGAQD